MKAKFWNLDAAQQIREAAAAAEFPVRPLPPSHAAVNHEAPEPNIPKGSGVQPPDGSTERALTFAKIIQTAGACGLAHNHGQGGQWLLCATERQLIAFAEALRAEPLSMSMFATRADYQAAKESKDHLSEQPSVDRCVLTDDQVVGMARRFFDVQPELSRNLIRFVRAMQDATLAAVKESGVREALARLVALADEIDKLPKQAYSDEWAERWDAAWEAARSALALHSGASARSAGA